MATNIVVSGVSTPNSIVVTGYSGVSQQIVATGSVAQKGDTGATGATGATGPAGASTWGAIGGTLASQTDLQTALNAKQGSLTLTTTGSSGAATLVSNTLNIPQYAGGGGTWGSITGTLASQTDLNTALTGKEPTITAGTSAQYYRGDKTMQTLNSTAVGLGNVDNTSDATKNSATAALSNKTLTLAAGTASVGPLKLTSGTLLTTPVSGNIEFDNSDYYFTNSLGRQKLVGDTRTQTLTNKTMSGAQNTFTNIPESAVTNLTTDLAAKQATLSLTTTGTSGAATLVGSTLNIPQYTGGGGGGTWGSITGTLSSQTDLNTALTAKADVASPTFTGVPAAPTASNGTNTTQLATTAFVQAAVNGLDDVAEYPSFTSLPGSGSTGTLYIATNTGFEYRWTGSAYLQVGGGSLFPTAVKTANYTAGLNEFIPVDTTSGNITITLPTAPTNGTRVAVKHVTRGGTNTITLQCGGSDVLNKTGGSTTATVTVLNQGVQYQYFSGIWYGIASDLGLTALDARYAPITGIPESSVTNLTTDLAAKVAKSGDTMTGDLVISKSVPEERLTSADTNYTRVNRTDTGNLATRYNKVVKPTAGGALSLNGTTAYVSAGTPSNLGITGNGAYTLSAWINPTALRSDGVWVSYGNSGGSRVISINTDGTFFRYVHFSNDRTTTTRPILNAWQLVTVTYDGTTERMYLNGTQIDSWTPTALSIVAGDALHFGHTTWSTAFAAACKIDDVRIYSRTLTPTEVSNLYTLTTVSSTGLTGWWKFDEGTGTTTADAGSGGNTGTLTGSPTWTTGIIPNGSAVVEATAWTSKDGLYGDEQGIQTFGDALGRTIINGTSTQLGNQLWTDGNSIGLGVTTGSMIGRSSSEKIAFYGTTPVAQQSATVDLGTVLSNLGFRVAGGAYPLTTSGTVTLSGSVALTNAPTYGGLPSERPLSTTTAIDGKTTGTTTLYTVPAGKTAVITKAVVRCTAATAITVAPTLGIGIAAGEDDIFTSTSLTGLTAATKAWSFASNGLMATGAATNVIKVGIDTAATGTTLTLAVDLWGYLI